MRGRVSLVQPEVTVEPFLLAGAMALLEQVGDGRFACVGLGRQCTAGWRQRREAVCNAGAVPRMRKLWDCAWRIKWRDIGARPCVSSRQLESV